MVELANALHVFHGDSAAEAGGAALELRRQRVLVHRDLVSYGPAPYLTDMAAWRAVREEFLRGTIPEEPELSFDQYALDEVLLNLSRLAEGDVVVWLAAGTSDQLFLSWLVHTLSVVGSKATLHQLQFRARPAASYEPLEVLGVGELTPERILELCPAPATLRSEEVSELLRVWRAYSARTPDLLLEYLRIRAVMPLLQRGLSELVFRYPDIGSGLGRWDELLLQNVREHAPSATLAIAHTLVPWPEIIPSTRLATGSYSTGFAKWRRRTYDVRSFPCRAM